MCYSARVWSDYRKYVREYGADVSVKKFYDLHWLRANGTKVSVQGGMDASFKNAQGGQMSAASRSWSNSTTPGCVRTCRPNSQNSNNVSKLQTWR